MTVTVIDIDDWSAVYFDGVLKQEGHSVRYDLLLSELVISGRPVTKYETRQVSGDWIEAHGMPSDLNDIPSEAYD